MSKKELKTARDCALYSFLQESTSLREFCIGNDFFPPNAKITGRALLVYFIYKITPYLEDPESIIGRAERTDGIADLLKEAKSKLVCVSLRLGKDWEECVYVLATLMIQAINTLDGCKFE